MTEKPKRPRDISQLAKFIVDVATGEEADDPNEAQKDAGRKGGKARAKRLTPEERSKIASIAASARWKKS